MSDGGWAILALVLAVVALFVAVLVVALWRSLARYVEFVWSFPIWLIVLLFVLFPPAFIVFVIGLVPYSQLVKKQDKEFLDGLKEHVRQVLPPSEHIKGDEKT